MKYLYKSGAKAYFAAEYEKAISYWKTGLEIANNSGNKKHIRPFIGNLGLVYSNLSQALSFNEQALADSSENRELNGGRGRPHQHGLGIL